MAIQRRLSDSRVNRAIDERDDKSGAKKPGVIDYKGLGEIPSFKPKVEESYKLNIIPYVAKNPLNPMVASGQIKLGELDLWLEVWAHRDIGKEKAFILCLNKMWGKPCPICDRKQKLYDDGQDDRAAKFQPSKRLLMYVQLFLKGEPQKIQLFEVAHYSFGAPLLSKADRLRKEGKIENFGDPDRGNLIKFYAEKGSKKGFIDFEDFEFLEREEDILDEDLENPSLDEFLVVYTAEEIQAMLDETSGADDDDDDDRRDRDEPRRGRGREESRRGRDDDRDPPRRGREESRRGRGEDRDPPRRTREESRSSRDEDRDPPRRERGERSESSSDRPARTREEPRDDEAPKPTENTSRQRPREDVPSAIPGDDRCPSGKGWGPEAVDKFPQCADCSKWSECLEGK